MLLCSGFNTGTHAHKDLIPKMTYKLCIMLLYINLSYHCSKINCMVPRCSEFLWIDLEKWYKFSHREHWDCTQIVLPKGTELHESKANSALWKPEPEFSNSLISFKRSNFVLTVCFIWVLNSFIPYVKLNCTEVNWFLATALKKKTVLHS